MEPEVGATIASQLEKKNCKIKTLIMDDDSTTINKIEKTVKHQVKKLSDYNHTKKQLKSKLWKLNTTYKKDMTPAVIGHFVKCFSFALKCNKNDNTGMKANLQTLTPHFFGEHENCGKKWCGFHKNPKSYKQTIVLTNLKLRSEMKKIMEPLLKNMEKISPCASTRANESFNHMVSQKAPKSRHYCSSASLRTRVKCAVAQKNKSYKYVSEINRKCGLSPGKITTRRCQMMEKKRKQVLRYKATPQFKQRQLEASFQIAKTEATKELQEGTSYETGCGLANSSEIGTISPPTKAPNTRPIELNGDELEMVFFDIETTSLGMDYDIVQLSARSKLSSFNVYITPSKPMNKNASEVTGLTLVHSIFCHNGRRVNEATTPQTAATQFVSWLQDIPKPVILYGHNCKAFDSPRLIKLLQLYRLLPPFTEKVEGFVDIFCHNGRRVNEATTPQTAATPFVSWLQDIPKPVILYGHNCKAFDSPRLIKLLQLYRLLPAFTEKVEGFVDIFCHNGRRVNEATTPQTAATQFVSWLQDIPKPVILYGHNCKAFDSPRLIKLLQLYRLLPAFTEKVEGFVDALPLFREKFPDFECHKQEYLVSKCLVIVYDAHNAEDDVLSLMKLVLAAIPVVATHIQYSFTTKSAVERLAYFVDTKENVIVGAVGLQQNSVKIDGKENC